jgi:hypothetical protein
VITLAISVHETKDRRLTFRIQRSGTGNKFELKAANVIYCLMYSLAKKVATDFAGRFTDKEPTP